MLLEERYNSKMKSDDRILVLEPIDGKPLSTAGLVDKRLFSGDNQLHAILDPQTSLWSLKYDNGIVPGPLKQRFTGFNSLVKFVEDYMKRRNVKVTKVID